MNSSCILVLELVVLFFLKRMTRWICESDILCTIEHSILTSGREGAPFHRNQCPRLQRLIICVRNRSVISHPHYAVVFVCNYILFLAYSIVKEYITVKVVTILCKGTIMLSFATNFFQ